MSEGSEQPANPRRKRRDKRRQRTRPALLPALLSALLAAAVFAPLLNCDLLWTDFDTVERTVYEPGDDWTQALELETIRLDGPLSVAGYHLEQAFGGRAPLVHRAVNLLLHIANAWLLLAILRRLEVRFAGWAAALFALHPAAVQILFWPGYRPVLLGLLWLLAAFYFALRKRGPGDTLASLAFAAAAAVTHPVGLVLPLLVCLLVCYEQKTPRLHHFNRCLPYFGLSLTIGMWLAGARGSEAAEGDFGGFVEHAARNFNFYLRQGLPAVEVTLFHPVGELLSTVPRGVINVLPFLVFLPVIALVVVGFRRPWSRALLLGAGAFALLILGGIFIDGRAIDGSPAFESRGVYFALPAAFGLAAAGAGLAGPLLRPLLAAGAGLLLAVEAGVSAAGSWKLRDERLVWEHFNRTWPEAWTSKAALADFYEFGESGAVDEQRVLELLEEAVALRPDLPDLRLRLARIHVARQRYESAIDDYLTLTEDAPANTTYIEELAAVYGSVGRAREQRGLYERLLVLDPEHPEAAAQVARQRLRDNRFDEAVAILDRIPGDAAVPGEAEIRAAARLDGGQRAEARELVAALRETQPESGLPLIMLAELEAAGNSGRADELAEQAIRADAFDAEVQRRYARFLVDHQPEATDRAINFAESADRLSGGDDPVFLRTLAACYRAGGRPQQATRTLERALNLARAEQLANLATAIEADLAATRGS